MASLDGWGVTCGGELGWGDGGPGAGVSLNGAAVTVTTDGVVAGAGSVWVTGCAVGDSGCATGDGVGGRFGVDGTSAGRACGCGADT